MYKIKCFFLLTLCFCLFGGALSGAAQTGGKVLYSNGANSVRQSDVNGLIAFYEWAFETEFTPEQRETYQEYVVAGFRTNAAASRKGTDNLLATFNKVKALDAATQREKRGIFTPDFIGSLRSQPNDELAQFLLGVYDAAHGGNESVSENRASEESNGASVGSLSTIVGNWVWGRSGSMTTTTSGVYIGGNGSRHTYEFLANGTAKYTGIMNVMTGGCNMQIFRTTTGKASLSGDTLTIRWTSGSFTRDDSCSPSKNYKKALPAETETYKVAFKDSYGQKQLCLTGKDETCFSPNNK